MGIISKYRYNKTTMRILLSFVILILLSFIQTTKATNAYVEEGLCNIVPIECDQSLQKNGVCCKGPNDDRLIYFPNSCLACMHNCQSFYMKTRGGTRCNDHDFYNL